MMTGSRPIALPGGFILAAALVLTLVISVVADLNDTHLFNPDWPPHARFHDVAMLSLLAAACGGCLTLLLRRTTEPHVAIWAAWFIPVAFWTTFFWAPWLVPGVSLRALPHVPPPTLAGVVVLPNAVAAFVLVVMSSFGLWRSLRSVPRPEGFQPGEPT